jgi:hypothetical protein
MRRAFVAAVVVLSVVLAGCAAGPFETAETASPTPAPPVTVEGELPFDAETVYRRVADLHGESLSTLPSVTVIVDDSADGGVSDRYHVTRFQRLLGLEPELRGTSLAGLARGDEVRLFTDAVESDASLERVLAHEFAHVVQFHRDAFGEVSEQVRGMGANESRLQTAVTEGAASYVERRYAERYLDEGGEPQS